MIELIFVIVIIGIMAAVALPRLTATRDDAAISAKISNLTICMRDIHANYMATGLEDINTSACDQAKDCFFYDVGATDEHRRDGGYAVKHVLPAVGDCALIQSEAETRYLSSIEGIIYSPQGVGIVR